MNVACLIVSLGKKYEILGEMARISFKKYHPDIPLFYITEGNKENYQGENPPTQGGHLKTRIAANLMEQESIDKLIMLGADTITCARLEEFLENDEDILGTLDYPYPLITRGRCVATADKHLNADIVCFNSLKCLKKVDKIAHLFPVYHEQGAINFVAWQDESFTCKVPEYPYEKSKFVYNVRAKGNFVATPGTMPWGEYIQKYYVDDEGLKTHDGKIIKVFHFCQGFSVHSDDVTQGIIRKFNEEFFNKETKEYFANNCGLGDFY